jgi:hypothetical protein
MDGHIILTKTERYTVLENKRLGLRLWAEGNDGVGIENISCSTNTYVGSIDDFLEMLQAFKKELGDGE